jgi:hypothetical protein
MVEKEHFGSPFNNREYIELDNQLSFSCIALTKYQRTADCSTLRAFHAAATMTGSLLQAMEGGDPDVNANADTLLLSQFIRNWFRQTRSTEPVVIGSRNEDAMFCSPFQKCHMINNCSTLDYWNGGF